MAVMTVSSLTESFTSGVPVSGVDVVLTKEKVDVLDAQKAGFANGDNGMRGVEGTGVVFESKENNVEPQGNGDGQEHGNDSEESEFDGILEVHD